MINAIFNRFHATRKVEAEAQILGALAATPDNHALYTATQDHLHEQCVSSVMLAMNFHTPDTEKLRAIERAAALYDAAVTLEQNRQAAIAEAKVKAEQASNQT